MNRQPSPKKRPGHSEPAPAASVQRDNAPRMIRRETTFTHLLIPSLSLKTRDCKMDTNTRRRASHAVLERQTSPCMGVKPSEKEKLPNGGKYFSAPACPPRAAIQDCYVKSAPPQRRAENGERQNRETATAALHISNEQIGYW